MPILVVALAVILSYVTWSYYKTPVDVEQMPKDPVTPFTIGDRVIVLGLPLSGKTYLMKRMTKQTPRILYFDPFHDYGSESVPEISANELIAKPKKYLRKSRFRYSIIPNEDNILEQLEDVTSIARAAGNLVLVLDEVGDYGNRYAGQTAVVLEKLARNGRHNGIVPVYISQVAMDIPKTVRRLATEVYSFRQVDVDDIEALRERYGDDFAEKVAHLPLHAYAKWTIQDFYQRKNSGSAVASSKAAPQPKEGMT